MPQSGRWYPPADIPIWVLSDAGGDDRPIRPDHLDRQSVHAALEFGVERLHYGAMLLQTGTASELRRGDSDAEMRLSAGSRTSVPFMSVALIEDFKMGRSEFLGKFLNNRVANGHMDTGSERFRLVKRN